VNDLSAEDLFSEWLAFCNRRTLPVDPTELHLKAFEAEDFRRKVQDVRKKEAEAKFESSTKPQLHIDGLLADNDDFLADYGGGDDVMQASSQPSEQQQQINIKKEPKSPIDEKKIDVNRNNVSCTTADTSSSIQQHQQPVLEKSN